MIFCFSALILIIGGNLINKNKLKDVLKSKISTLPEHKISAKTPLRYFYPYFHKQGIIVFEDSVFEPSTLNTACTDPNCMYCKQLFPDTCKKCATGFFLKNIGCLYECPDGWVGDTLRGKCIKINKGTNSDIIYSKSYSSSSCLNMCGKTKETNPINLVDCSCDSGCKLGGLCCTDYDIVNCDLISDNALKVKDQCSSNEGCDLCDSVKKIGDGKLKCNQCSEKYYLYKGECFKDNCPPATILNKKNNICKEITCIFIF